MMNMQSKNRGILIIALVVAVVLLTFPLRTLLAGYFQHRASSLVRDGRPSGDERADAEQRLARHRAAVRALDTAALLQPSRATYRKALSDLYIRMGNWALVAESFDEPLPQGLAPSAESFKKAEEALREAIRLEPTNPDYHFALGVLYDMIEKNSGRAEAELERAIAGFPVNSALRYAVALQHLNAGRRGDALEHATELATIEGMSFDAKSRSWLFKAFEIAWRATNDGQVVQGISPEDREALKVLKEYLKWRGIE